MKEYKIATGWTVFIFVICMAMILGFGFVMLMPFIPGMENTIPSHDYFFLYPLFIVLIVVFLLALRDAMIYRITVDKDNFSEKGVFTNKSLRFDNIQGYRIDRNYLWLISANANEKNIKVSNYIGKYDKLLADIKSRLNDVDQLNIAHEEQEILANDEYGLSTEERAENLSLARKKAKALNICSVIIAACFFFITDLFEYAFIAMLVLPVIAIILLRTSKELIHLRPGKGSAYPSVNTTFFSVCFVLFIEALRGFDIDNHTNIWVPALIITIVATLAVALNSKEADISRTGGTGILLGVILCSFAYGYGAVVISNCYYDRSGAPSN